MTSVYVEKRESVTAKSVTRERVSLAFLACLLLLELALEKLLKLSLYVFSLILVVSEQRDVLPCDPSPYLSFDFLVPAYVSDCLHKHLFIPMTILRIDWCVFASSTGRIISHYNKQKSRSRTSRFLRCSDPYRCNV